ncbi:hypothetical protein AGMMS49921_02780 [Endomicrobiia bacterium]|nr:hypothetical protein AGMMS49921_02780 [Endomicrobiia bacterium]
MLGSRRQEAKGDDDSCRFSDYGGGGGGDDGEEQMTVFGMSLRELMAFNEIIKIIAVGGGGEEGEGVEKRKDRASR